MNKQIHQPCFKCGSTDAATYFLDTGVVSCFSCGENYKHPQNSPESITEQPTKARAVSPDAFDTLPHRGFSERKITKAVSELFDVRVTYDTDGNISSHLYPYTKRGKYAGHKTRTLPKSFKFTGGSIKNFELFGQSRGSLGPSLVITEGELDAMAVAQAQMDHYNKAYSVVSLSAATGMDHLVTNLEWIRGFKQVILMFDNDEAGDTAVAQAARAIGIDRVLIADLGEHKDASDAYIAGGKDVVLRAIWDAKPYSPAGVVTGDAVWEAYQKRKNTVSHPYPECVAGINDKLYGMREGEIVLFTSGTGSGKSTLIKEIILHLRDTTDTKIGLVSLEESVGDTAEKFYQMYLGKNFKMFDVPEEEERKAHDALFGDERLILLDHQGSVSDQSLLDKMHALAAMGCKHIILDHITIAVSESSDGLTGNEAMDKTMSDLLKLCKQYDVWLGVISHLRKTGQGKAFEEGKIASLDDMKGSGSIKQIAFDVIAFARDLTATDENIRDTVHLSVLKTRNGYSTGPCGTAWYNKETCRLRTGSSEDEFTKA